MRVRLIIEKVESQCSPQTFTINIPGIATDVWLCITVEIRILLWASHFVWAVHLV